ncbi:unnamed protein product [Trifolium pratense]|uniref:Uncharacterized protein n=1 Tax=Trifolium pratense TaxID=57577 RepID=A0ACB0JA78_TRIPR|nr:unnamed protein product [Trifolium pratense]
MNNLVMMSLASETEPFLMVPVSVLSKLGSSSTTELHHKVGSQGEFKPTNMPPTSVMTRLILITDTDLVFYLFKYAKC